MLIVHNRGSTAVFVACLSLYQHFELGRTFDIYVFKDGGARGYRNLMQPSCGRYVTLV